MSYLKQKKDSSTEKDIKNGINGSESRPFKRTVFIAGHFFVGWVVINKGLLFINKIALMFFIFGWLIWAFLIFNFIRSPISSKNKDFKTERNIDQFNFSRESLNNLLMLLSLIAVFIGIIFSTNASFFRFK